MCNKTVNDTSYSSNKNDLYKNIIKKITNYFKERKAVSIVSAIIFCAVIVAACFSDISVCECATIISLTVAFIINLFLGKHYIIGFIISLLTYIFFSMYTYSNTYVTILNSSIKCIPILKCVLAILVVAIYFAVTCSFIYRSFQLVLKENTKLIFPVIALFVFFAILDNSNWEIVVLAVAVVTFVLEPKNLNILFKKVFHKKIKCGKKTLVVLRICVLLLQVLVYLSMELSKLLGKFVENCSYTCMPDGWLAFFRILIFVVLSTVMMHLLKTKKDKICYLLEKIIDRVDKYCKIGAEKQLDQSVSNCSQNENMSKEVQVSDMNNDLKVNNEN